MKKSTPKSVWTPELVSKLKTQVDELVAGGRAKGESIVEVAKLNNVSAGTFKGMLYDRKKRTLPVTKKATVRKLVPKAAAAPSTTGLSKTMTTIQKTIFEIEAKQAQLKGLKETLHGLLEAI